MPIQQGNRPIYTGGPSAQPQQLNMGNKPDNMALLLKMLEMQKKQGAGGGLGSLGGMFGNKPSSSGAGAGGIAGGGMMAP